jgi:tetratricopeptide (TPR) repeat protein
MAYARASYLRELHGDLDGAIDAMQMAVEAGYPGFENTEWCRVSLGELYEKRGDLDKAEDMFQTSIQMRENNPFAQGGLARIMIGRGEYEEAETLLLMALAAVPEIGFQEDLCRLYKLWGKRDEARRAYAGVIEMIEDDAAHGHLVHLDYAKILLDLEGDHEQALQKALVEYEHRPENIDVNLLLARIYMLQGKKDLAKVHMAKASRTGLSNPEIDELRRQLG